jgi:serine phosphatase RsbU (regulator of sigma subunit)
MVSPHTEPVAGDKTPLRTELKQLPGLDLHAQYHSARTGGDFFDAIQVGSRVAFLLTDIAGKKPDAHPIATATQRAFREKLTEFFSAPDANLMDGTALLVQEINRALIGPSHAVHFAPTFVGCYDLQLGVLAYINAGGQTAVLSDSDGTRPLPNVSVPMGLFSHLTYEPSMQAFEPGAKLLVVTKGIVEARRGRDRFGPERVLEVLEAANGNESAAEIGKAALRAVEDFVRPPWYSIYRFGRRDEDEDQTALAMVRSVHGEVGRVG